MSNSPLTDDDGARERQAWNDAILLAASIAEGLNGWGSPPAPELAYHISKCIMAAALPLAGKD